MQNFLEWLTEHDLLAPLKKAISAVCAGLYVIWCFVLIVSMFIGIPVLAIAVSGWWLLAYIPALVLAVITLMIFFYLDD